MMEAKKIPSLVWRYYTSKKLLIVILAHLAVTTVILFAVVGVTDFRWEEHPSIRKVYIVFGILLAVNLAGQLVNRRLKDRKTSSAS